MKRVLHCLREHYAQLLLEVGMTGVAVSMIVLVNFDMARNQHTVSTISPVPVATLLASCLVFAVGLLLIDEDGIFAMMRPTFGALAFLMGYMFVGISREAAETLTQQIAPMIFTGLVCVISTFGFAGMVFEGAKGAWQCLARPPRSSSTS